MRVRKQYRQGSAQQLHDHHHLMFNENMQYFCCDCIFIFISLES